MSLGAIRSYLKSLLSGVAGIGVVHDYERWAVQYSDLLNYYVKNSKLNGWAITRRSTEAEWSAMPVVDRTHQIEITGIYSLKDADASEKTFQDLIEAVDAAVRFDHTLGGNCLVAGPLAVEVVEARMFGSVLCHYCLLRLPVQTREIQG
jgi:hypothetical protein